MQINGVHTNRMNKDMEQRVKGTECAMTSSLRDSVHLVSDPSNLDSSVDEVFRLMLGVICTRQQKPLSVNPGEKESVTAVVGFGGHLSGACLFRCNARTAARIAGLMTGMEFDELDDTVKDAVGEICNMLAGGWKGKVPVLAGSCGLSVPAVITGRDYNLHVQSPEFQLHHLYTFESSAFDVTIVCDSLQ